MNQEFKIISKNRLPKWMIRIVDGGYGKMQIPLFERHPIDHFQTRKIKSRIDHKGYTEGRPDTEEIIHISQPYSLTYHWIKDMVETCEKHGIEFDIRGDSDHLPGSTVMVEWRKKESIK